MNYRRADIKGGTYFFTINLADRKSNMLIDEIDKLRDSINKVKQRHLFIIEAMVVLPDHLHLLITLPEGDNDFPSLIRQIKSNFSRQIPKIENIKNTRLSKQERGVWQRRYWEHLIRDETDFENHANYIHYNPVQHGYVDQVVKWEYSTIHRYIEKGIIPHNWGNDQDNIQETAFGER